jgi:O-antigen/teichoic acid export membrane protein
LIVTPKPQINFLLSAEQNNEMGPIAMVALTFFLISLLASSPAYAYLDPGTGSIILQAVVGTIAGGLVLIKLYWYKLKEFFKNRSTDKPADDNKN